MTVLQFARVIAVAYYVTPSDFGLFAMVLVVLEVAIAIADLGVSSGIVHFQEKSTTVLSSLFWFSVITSSLVAAGVFFGRELLAGLFDEVRLTDALSWSCLAIAVLPFGHQFHVLLQKDLAFRDLAMIEIASATVNFAASVTGAMLGFGAYALVGGYVCAAVARTILLAFRGLRIYRPSLHFAWRDLDGYLRFGTFLASERLVNHIRVRLPSIVIGRYLGAEPLGLFFFAEQFTARIYARLNPILTRVAYPVFSKVQHDNSRLCYAYLRLLQVLGIVSLPMLAGIAVVSADAIEVFFTSKWYAAKDVVPLLVLVGIFDTLANPIGAVLLAKGRTDVAFFANVYLLVQRAVLMWLFLPSGLLGVVASLLISSVIAFVGWAYALRRLIDMPLRSYGRAILGPAAAAGLMAGTVYFARKNVAGVLGAEPTMQLAMMIAVGVVVYLAFLWIFERQNVSELIAMIRPQSPAS